MSFDLLSVFRYSVILADRINNENYNDRRIKSRIYCTIFDTQIFQMEELVHDEVFGTSPRTLLLSNYRDASFGPHGHGRWVIFMIYLGKISHYMNYKYIHFKMADDLYFNMHHNSYVEQHQFFHVKMVKEYGRIWRFNIWNWAGVCISSPSAMEVIYTAVNMQREIIFSYYH